MATSLKGKDILRTNQITREEVALIMTTAARFENVTQSGGRLEHGR